MSSESSVGHESWLHARELWAGLSIITMWLAVLFVGIFGGDIVNTTPGGSTSSVPVVVLLLPFVLPATIVVARRGFGGAVEKRRGGAEEESREDPTREPAALRAKPA